jgi:ribosomal protein S27E
LKRETGDNFVKRGGEKMKVTQNYMPNLTEYEVSLYRELVAEGGWSEKSKYVPLVDKLVAWVYNTDSQRYYILKGHVGIYSIMLRIPLIAYGMEENSREKIRLEIFRFILSKYILKFTLTQKNVEECKKVFILFMFFPFCIWVPSFLKDELLELLKKAEAEYYEVSPNFVRTTCPVCDQQIQVDANDKMITCPECSSGFTL